MTPPLLTISPGRLLRLGESCLIESSRPVTLRIRRREGNSFTDLLRKELKPGVPWAWKPDLCGNHLIEAEGDGSRVQRPVAIIEAGWAVCQIAIGAFTSEDFTDITHPAGVSADYYVAPPGIDPDSSVIDPRWPRYEAEFGDVIHPHVMADAFGFIDPTLAQTDPNWDTLSVELIEARLRALQAWWQERGYTPLDHIATYTPCNDLIRACEKSGIRIVHSLIPEQNWSDGEWAINHWGMPNCPFWISKDDFRKPGSWHPHAVLGMSMCHYHVALAHLTRWSDFVLSPSHFDRWIRASDSGPEPIRFRQFLSDTVHGWKSFSDAPFFFVAGFEFGRTFGTGKMTEVNRKGLEALISLSGTTKLACATSRDVLAYYERHCPLHPETAFRQRDNWVGAPVNGKPVMAGDSVVIERNAYKAAFLEGESLPYLYYDYTIPWHYATRDDNIPADFAAECRQAVAVDRSDPGQFLIRAEFPLEHSVPVVLWDGIPEASPFPFQTLPPLDDGREVSIVELPKGWSGSLTLALGSHGQGPSFVQRGPWCIQSFGVGQERHSYLTVDLPLTEEAALPVIVRREARVDGPRGPLGSRGPGEFSLPFDSTRKWYRFWGCDHEDFDFPALNEESLSLLPADALVRVAQHEAKLRQAAALRLGGDNRIAFQLLCGADLPLGGRCRAGAFDRRRGAADIHANECGDGVLSLGPGKSFWYHPRTLPFKVRLSSRPTGPIRILLNSFDPFGLNAAYRVLAEGQEIGTWRLPASPFDEEAWFMVDLAPEVFSPDGVASLVLKTDQRQILNDWWKERGFIAALHALWVGV